jgi:hypothetical protein
MRANQLYLVIAAAAGGAVVQLVFQACGAVNGSLPPDAHAASPGDGAMMAVPIITNWLAYSPTLTSMATGAAVGNASTVGRWRRVGDTIELKIHTDLVGIPTGGGADFWEWGLPNDVVIDIAKSISSGNTGLGGIGNAFQKGSGNAKLSVFPAGSDGTRIAAEGDADSYVGAATPFAFGSNGNGAVDIKAAFAVAGWTATQ